MQIIRDEVKMKRWKWVAQAINFTGLGVLIIAMTLTFRSNSTEQAFWVQWVALLVGIMCWQVGTNLGYRYTRSPRPDESLDSGLKAAVPKSTLYHYILPTHHVLLTRSGPIVLHPVINTGTVTVSGEDGDKWRRKIPFYKRFIGADPRFGNPTKEAEYQLGQLVKFIDEKAPELEEIPIAVLLVFTNPLVKLTNPKDSRLPALQVPELKKFIRKNTGRSLPADQYKKLKEIFDEEAEAKGIDLS